MEKYGRYSEATVDHIKRHMPFACWIPNATNTHSLYVYLLFFTATMVEGTRLNVTLHVTVCPV